MLRDFHPHLRHARLALIVMALVALLSGCVPIPTTVAPVATTASSAPAETVTPAVAPTASAVPATDTAVPVSTETAAPAESAAVTATITAIVTATASTPAIVVQRADRSIQLVDLTGRARTLYQATELVDMSAIFPPANSTADAIFLPLSGSPGSVVKVSQAGGTVISAITDPVYGLAVLGEKLAYSTADLSANPIKSEIRISGLDGVQATTVYSQTSASAPTVLRVIRWARDGRNLYFGKEPIGLGGYIPFGGVSNIWKLDVETGQATELVAPRGENSAICIDDLAPLASTAADHCNPLVMELIDVASGTTRSVQLPPEITLFGTVGGAQFSPDSQTLAFALAQRNPEDEQGWVAVADVATATSRLVATSPAKDYFSVAGFLDADTLVLQSAGQAAGVWTVDTNGQNLQRLTDGVFLGFLWLAT